MKALCKTMYALADMVNQFAYSTTLWDMNKDKEEVQSIIGKILDRFDTIKKDYATMEDYRIMLREEAEIEIKYC